jgi:hypothetical protein
MLVAASIALSPEAEAKRKSGGPSKSQCSNAGMIVIEHADGGYECCINWGMFGISACDITTEGSCVRCDRAGNCESEPASDHMLACELGALERPGTKSKGLRFDLPRSILNKFR